MTKAVVAGVTGTSKYMASKFHITGVGTIGVRAFSKFAISIGLLQTHMVYISIYIHSDLSI